MAAKEELNKKLCNAARYGYIDTLQDYISKEADVNFQHRYGWTPLHEAASKGHTEVVDLLLKAGASPPVVDKEGMTPLHYAARHCQTKVVDLLLKAGASLSIEDNQGHTPLHHATWFGHTEVVDLLLKAGASMSIEDNQGWTPLHHATLNGKTDVIHLLIKRGASPFVVNSQGQSPHDFASGEAEVLLQKYKDKTAKTDEMGSLLPQDHSSMLNRLLGPGSYESFEMRVMVTGQFGVGKTSLVMILVGDEAPHEAQSTDGISLLEGRCGLDIDNRDWILIAKDDYNARDVVYKKNPDDP